MTIAGSDPSGGAGLQADLKTFHQHGVYGTSIVTLLTVQNTCQVDRVEVLAPEMVAAQIDAVLNDIRPAAVKTGALGDEAVIALVARRAAQFDFPLVVDPVMISKHGTPLLDRRATESLRRELIPHAYLVTPNLAEASVLAEMDVVDRRSMEEAAAVIARLGARNVLVKGGHLLDAPLDVLWSEGDCRIYEGERFDTKHTHGTGCVLSAAITARLARGAPLGDAVEKAKRFIGEAIRTAPGLGSGYGPINLHAPVEGGNESVNRPGTAEGARASAHSRR